MDIVQPWTSVAAGLAGLAFAGIGVSWWWSRRLDKSRRLIDRLKASRELLDQQNNQARRQIEHLQLELTELRLIAERVRRRAANTISPPDTLGPMIEPRPRSVANGLLMSDNAPGAMFSNAEDEHDNSGFEPTQIDRPRLR
ncbi:hypothetical protein [Roseateles amylovorans]|uniref:DUF1043 family protein n=1 Tax=Roseateles amylovorans TaxID=2978473 RepID=A0ABY6AVH8_9BURK|nr:hypothetical protein [Roseateles amylovorans]UXH77201.1 hypothetical protein N4261_19605 [Roseateles amylovorans]